MLHRAVLLPPTGRDPPDLRQLCTAAVALGVVEVHKALDGRVALAIGAQTPDDLAQIEGALASAFPGIQFREGPCLLPKGCPGEVGLGVARLQRLHHYPLNLSPGTDYADLLMRHLASFKGREVFLQILFGAASGWDSDGILGFLLSRRDKVVLQLKGYDDGGLFGTPKQYTPTPTQTHVLQRIEERNREQAHQVQIRMAVWGPNPSAAQRVTAAWLQQFAYSSVGNGLSWATIPPRRADEFLGALREHELEAFGGRKDRRLLSASELAHLLPIPWKAMHPELPYVDAPAHRPPPRVAVNTSAWVEIGEHEGQKILLPEPSYHSMFLGKTRTGKSTLLLNTTLQLLAKRPEATIVVLDPHGSLIEELKARLTLQQACQTIELDPSRFTFDKEGTTMVSIPFNVLHIPNRALLDTAARARAVELVTGDLIRTFKNVWGEESVGARVDYIVSMVAKGLLENEGTNLVDLYFILTDTVARRRFARTLVSSTVRSFVENELPKIRYEDLISSINKVGKVAENDILRFALCQRSNPVSFSALMRNRLILVNLSKSRIGTEASRFMGAAVMTQLWLNLLQTGSEKKPVYLVADEFQNFASESFRDMLSESAKYGLHLVLANQYLAQIPKELRSAIMGNVDSWVFFRMGVEDAELAHEIARAHRADFEPDDFAGLDNYRVVATFSNQFTTCKTLPPSPPGKALALVEDLLLQKTREYAAEETSMASPFTLDERQMGRVLEALGQTPATLPDLAKTLPLHSSEIFQSLRRCQQLGYLIWTPQTGLNEITPLGREFLASFQARRVTNTEGELHTEVLAKFSAFLKAGWGTAVKVVPQGSSGVSLPDGEFERDGVVYNIEVECSTISSKSSQVVKNLRKALEAAKRVVFVAPSQLLAGKLLEILERDAPDAKLDRDYSVMYDRGEFWRWPAEREPPFLSPSSPGPTIGPAEPPTNGPTRLTDAEVVKRARDALLSKGVEGTAADQIVGAMAEGDRPRFMDAEGKLRAKKLGKFLAPLGVTSEKAWDKEKGEVYRLYHLRGRAAPTVSPPTTAAEGEA